MKLFIMTIMNGLTLAALYFLVASGFTLVFGLMRNVNLAHGSLVPSIVALGQLLEDAHPHVQDNFVNHPAIPFFFMGTTLFLFWSYQKATSTPAGEDTTRSGKARLKACNALSPVQWFR